MGDGDVVPADELGSILTKLYVVDVPILPVVARLAGQRK